jgi:hypothetical protein
MNLGREVIPFEVESFFPLGLLWARPAGLFVRAFDE